MHHHGCGYTVTIGVRILARADIDIVWEAVASADFVVTRIDIDDTADPGATLMDISCEADSIAHARQISSAIAALPGMYISEVSDQSFLVHQGSQHLSALPVHDRPRRRFGRSCRLG